MENNGNKCVIKNDSIKNLKAEIIIPTLNEESTIGQLIKSIRSEIFSVDVSILVIDGGSTDKTVDICKRENIRVIRQKGKGKGMAMREAVDASDADIIVFMDGDGTYSIKDLELFLDPLLNDKADMVVGSRVLGKREKGSITTFNILGNKLFNTFINFALKSSVTDSLTGYRALWKSVFTDLVLFSNSFEIEVEITVELLAKGYRIIEVPINYGIRKDSKTKLNPLKDGIRIAKTLFFIIMNVRPLLFFSIISGIVFGISTYPISIVLYEKIVFGDVVHLPSVIFAAVLIVTAVILLVLGILSEMIVHSRRRIEYLLKRNQQ